MTLQSESLAAFEQRFGHRFADRDALNRALTHASTGADRNYERLEFLGDRVLGLVVAHLLYDAFSQDSEGDLARRHASLVSGATLAAVAARINLGEVLHLSDGERASGGARNENILADVMEALIGALYLDAGISGCESVIGTLWRDLLHTMAEPPRDPKTALQEWAQARGLGLPEYSMVDRSGPDHAPVFNVSVSIEGYPAAGADGPSRRAAEKLAAIRLLALIESGQYD
ncbi:MAG TPA: ribonuclease III [Micavibrio sp.]|jgi:ribonuclease-3